VRIIIFTKLLPSWGNSLEMVIIPYFSELMSSNFLEFVSKSFRPIVNIRNLAHWRVVSKMHQHHEKNGLNDGILDFEGRSPVRSLF